MGRLSDKLKTQLSPDYFQYNFLNIGEYTKLRTYVKFKLNSNREDYLDIEDISLKKTENYFVHLELVMTYSDWNKRTFYVILS